MSTQLLTRKEAATKLRICLITLDKLIARNEISVVSIGKRVLITEGQVQSFIEKGGAK